MQRPQRSIAQRWIAWHERARLLTRGLLALALLIQGIVSATHIHPFATLQSDVFAIAALMTDEALPTPQKPTNLPDGHRADCVICHLSGIGAAALAPVIALVLPSLTALPVTAAPAIAAAPPITAHPAPRGPPISFVQS